MSLMFTCVTLNIFSGVIYCTKLFIHTHTLIDKMVGDLIDVCVCAMFVSFFDEIEMNLCQSEK